MTIWKYKIKLLPISDKDIPDNWMVATKYKILRWKFIVWELKDKEETDEEFYDRELNKVYSKSESEYILELELGRTKRRIKDLEDWKENHINKHPNMED